MRYLSVTEIAKVRFLPARLGTFLKMQRNNLEDILDFHVKFERIHPFQDGNGRVG